MPKSRMLAKTTATAKLDVQTADQFDTSFKREVQTLADEFSELAKSYSDLTVRIIECAKKFRILSEKARELDGSEDDGIHYSLLLQTMTDVAKSSNKSIWSQWNTIGSKANDLIDFSDSLPPYRESIYQVALAIDEKKPVNKWISENRLTSQTTLREIATLRKQKKSNRKNRDQDNYASVTFYFENYSDAIASLADIIRSHKKYEFIKSDFTFFNALKSEIGVEEYAKSSARFKSGKRKVG